MAQNDVMNSMSMAVFNVGITDASADAGSDGSGGDVVASLGT